MCVLQYHACLKYVWKNYCILLNGDKRKEGLNLCLFCSRNTANKHAVAVLSTAIFRGGYHL